MAEHRFYQFGPFRWDATGRLLFREGKLIPLAPKVADVLLLLVENAGKVVEKEELLRKVWQDAFIEEGSLTRTISVLRKALGEGPGEEEYVATISKRGYRFAAPVTDAARAVVTAKTERVMLAVLPFENFSEDRTQEYFSDGLTEEMITVLGRLNPQRLGVIARSSAMTYKNSDKSIQQIGRELGVTYILEGSARRSGNRIRIAAQLIQTSDQTHVWAENYERDLGDILVLQSDVAQAIALQIQIKLAPEEQERLRTVHSLNPEAYEAYLQGRYLWNKRTLIALQGSLQQFKKAIRHDPNYAAAYAGLADSYLTLLDENQLPRTVAIPKAIATAEKALGIDAGLAEAHNSLAHAYFHELDWAAAEGEFQRGIALNPSCVTVHFYYANYLVAMGRFDEAIAEAKWAQSLDPRSLAAEENVARILYQAGRYEQAIAHSLKVLESNPAFLHARETLGFAYEEQGRYKDAIAAFQKAVASSARAPRYLADLARTYGLAGREREARKLLQQLKRVSKKKSVPSYLFAWVYVGLGDTDQALKWLARDSRERSNALPFLKTSPRFAPLRSDPRFQQLVRELGLAS
ncbi:MAG TPA: tetratricopeptide repeat protein [Candidatus Angelobacter sp.]|nr:tetratricopeptide repeat protein [Candidatus Angelobacter sp.]